MICFRPTREERSRHLPGDELVPDPILNADHAITLPAPPGQVWPWLAQMGAGRAGWYSYDRLDNGGQPSLRHIDPALQDIAPGTLVPAIPGATDAFFVVVIEPPNVLVLGVPGPDGISGETGTAEWQRSFSRASWAFVLMDCPAGSRLHVRARTGLAEFEMPVFGVVHLSGIFARPLGILVHDIMACRQLRNLRRRVAA